MINLKKSFLNFLINDKWYLLGLLLVSLIFFYPVILQNKLPLPLDALVGAHLPWTELTWEEFPAGVPIKNLEITDSISQFYLWKNLVGDFWRAGTIPLWNQYMFSGTPFLATLHSSALYPLNFLYLIFNNENTWSLLIYSQVLLSSVFMFVFLRSLRLSKEASIFGAITFSFSGYMVAWMEFATGGHSGLWLPLLLFFELYAVKKGSLFANIAIPLTFLFIFTAGDFQIPVYIVLTYILFGFYLVFFDKDNKKNAARKLGKIFLGLLLGIILSLPQLLPSLELFLSSIRVGDMYIRDYNYGLMDWEKFTNFIWPDFFGNVVTRNYWARFTYHEYIGFAGTTSLVFMVYSLIKRKRLKYEMFFWLLLVAAILFVFPTYFGLLPYKYQIPGIGSSFASRIIYLIDFCIVVIASFGFSKWFKEKDMKVLKALFYLIGVNMGVASGLLLSILIIKKGSGNFEILPKIVVNMSVSLRNMIPSLVLLVGLLGILSIYYFIRGRFGKIRIVNLTFQSVVILIIIVSSGEMLRFAWKNTPFSPKEFNFPKTEAIEFLKNQDEPFRISGPGLPMNYFMYYELSSAEGYDPIYPNISAKWLSLVNHRNFKFPSTRYGQIHDYESNLINYANVKYVIDYKKRINKEPDIDGVLEKGINEPRYKLVFNEGDVNIFENLSCLPRVWLTSKYETYSGERDFVKKYFSSIDDRIFLEHEPNIMKDNVAVDYSITDFNQKFNEITFNVKTSSDSLVFLSETYDKGWDAFVNDNEVRIHQANYAFQAIPVPVGNHTVRFTYKPDLFYFGVKMSLLALVVMVAAYVAYIKSLAGPKK